MTPWGGVRIVEAGLNPAPTGDINRLSDWFVSFQSELGLIREDRFRLEKSVRLTRFREKVAAKIRSETGL
jgi:hypothetical protein